MRAAPPRRIVPQNSGMDPAPPVYAALDALGISYERHEHPAVFTAEDASKFWDPIPGVQCKNLFLRNKKGDRHYLVVVEISKRVDLKDLVPVSYTHLRAHETPEHLVC